MYIPTPSIDEVEKYLNDWEDSAKGIAQEKALNCLFLEIYPKNTNLTDILIKSSVLNDFYSTNIYSIYDMAKHIYDLNIDERLKNGDLSLVKDIATLKIKDRELHFYSFASKYCSHHYPNIFPIYDSYVDKVLMHFKKKDKFFKFIQEDLKDYYKYSNILKEFSKYYKLENYTLKDLDKYLWALGKKYFPIEYSKSK